MGSKDEASFKTSASKTGMYLVFTNKSDKKEILVNLVCVDITESNIVVVKPAGLTDDLIHPVSFYFHCFLDEMIFMVYFYRISSFIHLMLAFKCWRTKVVLGLDRF